MSSDIVVIHYWFWYVDKQKFTYSYFLWPGLIHTYVCKYPFVHCLHISIQRHYYWTFQISFQASSVANVSETFHQWIIVKLSCFMEFLCFANCFETFFLTTKCWLQMNKIIVNTMMIHRITPVISMTKYQSPSYFVTR